MTMMMIRCDEYPEYIVIAFYQMQELIRWVKIVLNCFPDSMNDPYVARKGYEEVVM